MSLSLPGTKVPGSETVKVPYIGTKVPVTGAFGEPNPIQVYFS